MPLDLLSYQIFLCLYSLLCRGDSQTPGLEGLERVFACGCEHAYEGIQLIHLFRRDNSVNIHMTRKFTTSINWYIYLYIFLNSLLFSTRIHQIPIVSLRLRTKCSEHLGLTSNWLKGRAGRPRTSPSSLVAVMDFPGRLANWDFE